MAAKEREKTDKEAKDRETAKEREREKEKEREREAAKEREKTEKEAKDREAAKEREKAKSVAAKPADPISLKEPEPPKIDKKAATHAPATAAPVASMPAAAAATAPDSSYSGDAVRHATDAEADAVWHALIRDVYVVAGAG
jgi:hypothetical protein